MLCVLAATLWWETLTALHSEPLSQQYHLCHVSYKFDSPSYFGIYGKLCKLFHLSLTDLFQFYRRNLSTKN